MVSTSVIYVNTWTVTNLPILEEWKAELAQFADPQRTVFHEVVTCHP